MYFLNLQVERILLQTICFTETDYTDISDRKPSLRVSPAPAFFLTFSFAHVPILGAYLSNQISSPNGPEPRL